MFGILIFSISLIFFYFVPEEFKKHLRYRVFSIILLIGLIVWGFAVGDNIAVIPIGIGFVCLLIKSKLSSV